MPKLYIKFIVSGLAIVLTSVVYYFFQGSTQPVIAPAQVGGAYYLLSSQLNPNAVPIEGCGTEYLERVGDKTTGDLQTALNTLFSIKLSELSSLYNSTVTAQVTDSTVDLQGQLISAGTCDVPRILNQIQKTISEYGDNYKVTLNGSESAFRCFGDESGTCE
jgi:hypothetical protein